MYPLPNMGLKELKMYILDNTTHDANLIEQMGFGEISKLVRDGAMNKDLLLKLIDLSSKETEKNTKDEQAGRLIFDQCCDDKQMKDRVNTFYAENK